MGAYGDPAVIGLQTDIHLPAMPRVAQIVRHMPQSKVAGSWKRDAPGLNGNGYDHPV